MKIFESNTYDSEFWKLLESIIELNRIVIDRPKNSSHPKYNSLIYPIDYGYIENTSSMDKNEIDIWVGSNADKGINGILCVIDPVKNDSEIKILYACTSSEIETIYLFHNRIQKALLIERN